MEATIVLIFLFGYPLLIGALFRVNTSFLFVTILAAELLERYFRDDAELVLRTVTTNEQLLAYTGFVMLIIPLLLTGIFLKGSLTRSKTILHFIPLILCGVVFAAFAAPILPVDIQNALVDHYIGALLIGYAKLIVGITVFLQLLALLFLTKAKPNRKKRD